MSVIVTDTGFGKDDWTSSFTTLSDAANDVIALDLSSDTDLTVLVGHLDSVRIIRVDFPTYSDGRGFTIARQLRLMGYRGRLRAKGHVISDQLAMARRCGFDEIEISEALAARQPEADWLFRANWQKNDYQSRLRG